MVFSKILIKSLNLAEKSLNLAEKPITSKKLAEILSPETLVFSCMTMTETHGKNKDKDREDNDKDEITKGLNMCHMMIFYDMYQKEL